MSRYTLQLIENHPVIEHDGLTILIDTGAPVTIARQTILPFMGHDHATQTAYGGADIPTLRQLTHIENLDVLMGMNILSRYKIVFDYPGLQVDFEEPGSPFDGTAMPLYPGMAHPIVELEALGANRRFFLDTGAKLSYLDAALCNGLEPSAREADFHPAVGRFDTPVYLLPVGVGGRTFDVRFGNLPAPIQGLLGMGNASGIIGSDLFHRFKVCLDVQGGHWMVAD